MPPTAVAPGRSQGLAAAGRDIIAVDALSAPVTASAAAGCSQGLGPAAEVVLVVAALLASQGLGGGAAAI